VTVDENEWVWEGRSRALYDAMIEGAPAFLRSRAVGGFARWMQGRGHAVTEDLLLAHVRETLPEPYRGMLLARLAQIGG
jgi:hypothetical protein